MTYFVDGLLSLLKLDVLRHRLVRWCHAEGAGRGRSQGGGSLFSLVWC